MALQLMKLNVQATTAVDVNPFSQKFFHVTAAETAAGDTLTIDIGDFFNDAGEVPTALPALLTDNSYYNVNVNGVLQMNGITSYIPTTDPGTGSLSITVPAGDEPILAGTPVVLEVVNFRSTSTTDVAT